MKMRSLQALIHVPLRLLMTLRFLLDVSQWDVPLRLLTTLRFLLDVGQWDIPLRLLTTLCFLLDVGQPVPHDKFGYPIFLQQSEMPHQQHLLLPCKM